VQLQGTWAGDALSRNGRRLYLIEYRADVSYLVRVHLSDRGLGPGAITDPERARADDRYLVPAAACWRTTRAPAR